MSPPQIVFLRGINLGKNRRLAMGDLRKLLEAEGYEDVRTHLQSGNLLLTAKKTGDRLARDLERQLKAGLGLETTVIVRTRAELARVVKSNPLAKVAKNPSRHQVTFLAAKPDAKRVRALADTDYAPEQYVIKGREAYAWHPDGLQRSKLAKALADGLGVVGTARNWNTVTRLLELADE